MRDRKYDVYFRWIGEGLICQSYDIWGQSVPCGYGGYRHFRQNNSMGSLGMNEGKSGSEEFERE